MNLPRRALPFVLVLLALVAPAAAEAARTDAPGAAQEPLAPQEWWRSPVGADAVVPPGAGKPVTVIDSGLDITHEEFRSRPDTTLMNTQTLFGIDDDHGTEVASVVAAPVNHLGLVGVYPQAALRSWDASPFGVISATAAAQGIVAAANAGPGVINMSFGGPEPDPRVERAILYAVRRGSLVVVSAGNEGLAGNPLSYPASYPHVLTVSATDQTGITAVFSSQSRYVDLAAPGSRIPVAEPVEDDPSGYIRASGTSFSAPMVAGAAALVWTARPDLDNTQLFEVMRMSARDVGPPGHDLATGFGVLDIPAALAFPAPPPDPSEPNDDVDEVSPTGLFAGGQPAITTPANRSATLLARVDRYEDPHDVYRVFVPPHGSSTARTEGGAVDLRIYPAGARSISVRPVAISAHRGQPFEAATVRNRTARGFYAYVEIRPEPVTARTSYTLRVTTPARP